jgi:hypothetical protein
MRLENFMRFILRALVVAGTLAFGTSQFASAAAVDFFKPMLTAEGFTKLATGAPAPYAVLSPKHQLFFIRKAGAPGTLAPPGTYKLDATHSVVVGKGGIVTDQKSWTWFGDPTRLPSGVGYYN